MTIVEDFEGEFEVPRTQDMHAFMQRLSAAQEGTMLLYKVPPLDPPSPLCVALRPALLLPRAMHWSHAAPRSGAPPEHAPLGAQHSLPQPRQRGQHQRARSTQG